MKFYIQFPFTLWVLCCLVMVPMDSLAGGGAARSESLSSSYGLGEDEDRYGRRLPPPRFDASKLLGGIARGEAPLGPETFRKPAGFASGAKKAAPNGPKRAGPIEGYFRSGKEDKGAPKDVGVVRELGTVASAAAAPKLPHDIIAIEDDEGMGVPAAAVAAFAGTIIGDRAPDALISLEEVEIRGYVTDLIESFFGYCEENTRKTSINTVVKIFMDMDSREHASFWDLLYELTRSHMSLSRYLDVVKILGVPGSTEKWRTELLVDSTQYFPVALEGNDWAWLFCGMASKPLSERKSFVTASMYVKAA